MQGHAARNRISSASVWSGTSSVSRWPDGKALPDTCVARSRQIASTSYFRPTIPFAPQSANSGHKIFRSMSASSCEINGCGCAIILARRVNHSRIVETAAIFGVGFRLYRFGMTEPTNILRKASTLLPMSISGNGAAWIRKNQWK